MYAEYHGYALPEARVCWGDCGGSFLAVGQPPEVSGLQGSLSGLYGSLLKSLGHRVAFCRICSVLGNRVCPLKGMQGYLGIPRVRLVSGYAG